MATWLVLVALAATYTRVHRIFGKTSTIIWRLAALTFVFATAQAPDILLLNGKQFSIFTNPLERFLEQNPDKRWKPSLVSMANWRGYEATWQVKEDRLMLMEVEVLDAFIREPDHDESVSRLKFRSVMSAVFPGQKEVFADWFTGHVILLDGECIHYVHMGYASTYEKYIVLRVEKGIVTRQWALDHEGFLRFRNAQFEQFKRTEEYRKTIAELFDKREEWSDERKEGFMRAFYSGKYTSTIFES
jgi:hypothetical protein